MADQPQDSMAQLLATLGISREDLVRRSQEMRHFLSADSSFLAQQPAPAVSKPATAPPGKSATSTAPKPTAWLSSTPLGVSAPQPAPASASRDASPPILPQTPMKTASKPDAGPSEASDKDAQPASRPRTPSQTRQDASQTAVRSAQDIQELVQKAFAGYQQPAFTPSPTKSLRGRQTAVSSPLPASSPLPQRSPSSSPVRVVNLVSSAATSPTKEPADYGAPYMLPPGPYSDKKPDWSYAAMIGQAVLSSPQHRLTLQEIYEWITTVYPFFKRGETTWMNSIRHVLSTTVTFRKVPRDRALGRTLWAIYDDDLPCFEGGGFKKHLCKDYVDSLHKKGLQPSHSSEGKSRGKGRKREDDEPDAPSAPPLKKPKLEPPAEPTAMVSLALPPIRAQPSNKYGTQARTIFPSSGTNQQSYYDACMAVTQPQPQAGPSRLPDDLGPSPISSLLPPVMTTSTAAVSSSSSTKSYDNDDDDPMDEERHLITSTPQSALRSQIHSRYDDDDVPPPTSSLPSSPLPESSCSLPDLTPDGRSSSPPTSSYPATSDADIDEYLCVPSDDEEDLQEEVPKESYPDPHDIVPGSLLNKSLSMDGYEDRIMLDAGRSGKIWSFSNHLDSPSRTRTKRRLSTPPPPEPSSSSTLTTTGPRTPPKYNPTTTSRRTLLSPHSTPLSHQGFHMSPSTSLMHYKSNLNPPPVPIRDSDDADAEGEDEREHLQPNTSHLRTPSRSARPDRVRSSLLHLGGSLSHTTPRTPGMALFKTPGGTNLGLGMGLVPESPFGGGIDPCDPRSILSQEVRARRRMDFGDGDDGEGGDVVVKRSSLLYQSPGLMGWSGGEGGGWY